MDFGTTLPVEQTCQWCKKRVSLELMSTVYRTDGNVYHAVCWDALEMMARRMRGAYE